MTPLNELLVSARDAEALASVVGDRHLAARFEDETYALAELLMEARLVPHDTPPRGRVASPFPYARMEATDEGPARGIPIRARRGRAASAARRAREQQSAFARRRRAVGAARARANRRAGASRRRSRCDRLDGHL